MTINIADNSPRISYSVASGVTQTSFAVPFEFFDDEDLNVYVDGVEKSLTTDFTVSGGDGSTGTVTISVTGASGGSTVVITRDIPLERTTDFPVSGAFNIVALNTELDRLVAVAADLNDLASRAITPLDYDPTVSYTLPTVNDRKGKTLAFNEVTGSVQAGPSIADTQSVADASADIALLADIQDGTVATNAITTAANVSSQIATLGAISSDITTVSGISSNVTTVASNDANVTTVAGISSNVTTVADNIADINTVADDLNEAVSEINTVATNITNVNTVGTNITNVNTTAGSINNVNTVASNITNVNTVSTNISNVNTVAGISANVTTVAGQTTNLQNVTDNLTAIQNAASNATSASNSATAAAASAAAAALSADTFDDTYLGSKASDPSLDNDGDALNAGDLYFNTTSNTLKVYSGSAWQDAAVDSSSFVQTAGDSMTGNLSFGDNDKAIFGAGSDLQIYHNGSHSYIDEVGTGSLLIRAEDLVFQNSDGSENYGRALANGAFELNYNAVRKLATTSTGIDVTGTVTADGLTVAQSSGANILLESTTTGATTGDIFGEIEFKTNDSNSAGIKGKIDSYSEGAVGNGALRLFTGDTTGLYQRMNIASNGDISFYEDTGTTAKFFWDASAERLGIGTSSPAEKLHVSGGTNDRIVVSGSGSSGLLFKNTGGTDLFQIVYDDSSTDATFITTSDDLIFRNQGGTQGGSVTERMRIDSSGNVGIGTSSPSESLHVSGKLLLNNGTNSYFDAAGSNGLVITNPDAVRFEIGSERMRITSSGNVGIGTTSPASKIHIHATDTAGVSTLEVARFSMDQISNYGDGVYSSYFYNTSTEGARIGMDVSISGGALYFSTGGSTERMRIDSSGNVGINTPAQTEKLVVEGAIASTYQATNFGLGDYRVQMDIVNSSKIARIGTISGTSTPSGSQGTLTFLVNDSEKMRIDTSGNLLVGTTGATLPENGTTSGHVGVSLDASNYVAAARYQNIAGYFNRIGSDGDIAQFRKDGTTVGSIGNAGSNLVIGDGQEVGLRFSAYYDAIYPVNGSSYADANGLIDLGRSGSKFRNAYLSGGVYLGGTGAANRLEDYESGSWTPSLLSDTDATWGYNSRVGRYVKVGGMVHIWGAINLSSRSGGSGGVFVTGLPFTMMGSGIPAANVGILIDAMDQDRRTVTAQLNESNSNFRLIDLSGGTEAHGAMNVARFSGNENVRFMFAYPV